MKEFKTLSAAQAAYRKTTSLGDNIKVEGKIFNMVYYDMKGKEIIYQNKKTKQSIYITTNDRYKDTSDAIFDLI
jgi:hypothetical protein